MVDIIRKFRHTPNPAALLGGYALHLCERVTHVALVISLQQFQHGFGVCPHFLCIMAALGGRLGMLFYLYHLGGVVDSVQHYDPAL